MSDPMTLADVPAQVGEMRTAVGWMAFLIAVQITVGVAVFGACVVILRRVFRVLSLVETHGGIGDRVVRSATKELTAEVRRVGESVKAEAAQVAAAVAATLVLAAMFVPETAKPGCTPRIEGLPSIVTVVCVLPFVRSV